MLAATAAAERRIGCMLGPSRSSGYWTPESLGACMGLEEVELERVEAEAESAMVKQVFGSGARPRCGHRPQWAVVRG